MINQKTQDIIDYSRAHPDETQAQIAQRFGVTAQWVSYIERRAGGATRYPGPLGPASPSYTPVRYTRVCQDCGAETISAARSITAHPRCARCSNIAQSIRMKSQRVYPESMEFTCTCCDAHFVKSGRDLSNYLSQRKRDGNERTFCPDCKLHWLRQGPTCREAAAERSHRQPG